MKPLEVLTCAYVVRTGQATARNHTAAETLGRLPARGILGGGKESGAASKDEPREQKDVVICARISVGPVVVILGAVEPQIAGVLGGQLEVL